MGFGRFQEGKKENRLARILACTLALTAVSCDGAKKPSGAAAGTVTLKGRTLAVTVKKTERERRYAPVLFDALTEDRGYLMAWPRERYVKLESQDAKSSFDVAFLNRSGKIVDTRAFIVRDEEGVMSAAEAAYALFVAPGLLKKLGAADGDAVELPPDLAPEELAVLKIGGVAATVELALTEPERQHGLMFRPRMSANDGMLFAYPDEYPRGFWMRNTLIPLDIAFFKGDGTFLNVNETPTVSNPRVGPWPSSPSAGPARFVLEMNLGWFRRHGLVDESGRPKSTLRVEMPPEAVRGSF